MTSSKFTTPSSVAHAPTTCYPPPPPPFPGVWATVLVTPYVTSGAYGRTINWTAHNDNIPGASFYFATWTMPHMLWTPEAGPFFNHDAQGRGIQSDFVSGVWIGHVIFTFANGQWLNVYFPYQIL